MTVSARLLVLWNPTPSDPRIADFVGQATFSNKTDGYDQYEWEYLQDAIHDLFSINRAIPPSPEVFEAILLPLIANTESPMMILRGMHHPDCPASVLSAACHSGMESVRRVAAKHPNCPEVDAVYATLANSGESK